MRILLLLLVLVGSVQAEPRCRAFYQITPELFPGSFEPVVIGVIGVQVEKLSDYATFEATRTRFINITTSFQGQFLQSGEQPFSVFQASEPAWTRNFNATSIQ